jgi:carbamoyl-phosphate synthase large subunit
MNVLVLSSTAAAINYIHALSDDPAIRLHVTDSNPCSAGLYLPGIVPLVLPPARDQANYRRALDRIIAARAIEVLIPTSDYDVAAVMAYLEDGWDPPVALFRPPFAAFECLSHKRRLMDRLIGAFPGNIPQTWGSAAASGLSFPVVVKPASESGGKGVAVVSDRPGLEDRIAKIKRLFGDDYVVQEYIPGRTYVATLIYDHDGSLVVGVGMRSHLTTYTWGGAGRSGELVERPDLIALADDLTRAAGGWRGPINLELREHPDHGRFYLMEANCRLNGYSYLTTLNGLNLPRIVLALLTDRKLPALAPVLPAQRRNFIFGLRETPVGGWVTARE